MGPDVENVVDVVRWYIKGMPVSVLFVYCCVVLHCHVEQNLAFPFSLARFCNEDMRGIVVKPTVDSVWIRKTN